MIQKLILTCVFAVAISVIFGVLSLGRPKLANGWVVLRPTYLLYVIGALSIPMALFLIVFGSAGLFGPAIQEWGNHPRIFAGAMLGMGIAFPYCSVTTFFVKVRFNDEGVEKIWFGRPTFFPWAKIRAFKRSFFLGPVLVDATGRAIQVSQYLVGFSNLAAMADAKGVAVGDEFR